MPQGQRSTWWMLHIAYVLRKQMLGIQCGTRSTIHMVDTPHIMCSTETDVGYLMWHKVNDPHGGYSTYHRFNGNRCWIFNVAQGQRSTWGIFYGLFIIRSTRTTTIFPCVYSRGLSHSLSDLNRYYQFIFQIGHTPSVDMLISPMWSIFRIGQ